MAKQPIFVTGDKELDKRLAKLEAKVVKKALPKAAKEAAKVSQRDFKARAPKDTGALSKSTVIRVRRKKHKATTGKTVIARGGYMKGKEVQVKRVVAEDVGASLIIDQDRFKRHASKGKASFKVAFAKKRNGKTRAIAANFYPRFVELGNKNQQGQRPLTKSLYNNEQPIRKEFIDALRPIIMAAGK